MSHVQCAMDDGGQRLLDVIEDTHVLETFLRENFSSSGLEDSPRFDNVSSSTDSGLISSGGLDSLVFDGQLVDPLRGGPNHPGHHSHQVSPHVLQQVLHPSGAQPISGSAPHQLGLHAHQIHSHQHSNLQQSSLLHHSQHQSSVGTNLDSDCIPRSSCNRQDADNSIQQLLASGSAPPLGSAQHIVHVHQQSHPIHQPHHSSSLVSPQALSAQNQSSLIHNPFQSQRQQHRLQPPKTHSSQSMPDVGLLATSMENSCSRVASLQPPLCYSHNESSSRASNLQVTISSASNSGHSSSKVQIIPQNHGSILSSGTQLLTSSAPLVQPSPANQLISNGSLLAGSQVLSSTNLLSGIHPSGHLLSGAPQVLSNANGGGLTVSAGAAPLYVTPTSSSYVIPNSTPSPSVTTTTSTVSTCSFAVPSKSPVCSVPRASPISAYSTGVTSSNSLYQTKSPSPIAARVSSCGSVQTSSSASIGVMQGLVPHLPLSQLAPQNGMVLSQGGASMKQVMQGGQLIQLMASTPVNQAKHPVAVPKPIQPKQPQLLPKPHGLVRQPTPPPATKTIISTRATPPSAQQPIVIGSNAGTAPTVIAGPQNLGSFVINSSLLQTQPFLIPQPNGMQLLVRPAAAAGAAQGQTLLVPMPSQSTIGKMPQTFVIPASSGQAPAFVIPQGLTQAIGGGGVIASGGRQPQPLLRLLAPQAAPLQLQQINTANGPMFVALPQQSLNLSSMFASNTVRALAPQVASNTLQLSTPNMTPVSGVNLNHLQLAGGGTLVSIASSQATQQVSIPTSVSTSVAKIEDHRNNMISPRQVTSEKSSHRKKSKKKKKESKDGKEVSINLNELLKETGIVSEMMFDENDFASLDIEPPPPVSLCPVSNISPSPIKFTISSNQVPISTSAQLPIVVSSNAGWTNPSFPTSMCFTLDAQGKLVLGSADGFKSQITAVAGSMPTQVTPSNMQLVSSSGMHLPGANIVIGTADNNKAKVNSPYGHIVALHSKVNSGEPTLAKLDRPIACTPKITPVKNHEMIKVAHNTQLIGAPTTTTNGSPFITSLLTNGPIMSSHAKNGSKPTCSASQNSSVIFSSNNIVPSAYMNGKPLPSSNVDSNSGPVSEKVNSYQNEYVASVKNHLLLDSKPKKSKKRKREKGSPPPPSIPLKSPKSMFNGGIKSEAANMPTLSLSPSVNSMPSLMTITTPANKKGTPVTSPCSTSMPTIVSSPVSSPVATPKPNLSGGSMMLSGVQPMVLQPGQQVKQLFISPHNQEALKKVHGQIKELQSRKIICDSDKVLYQKLMTDYKKIMATGTPICVSSEPSASPVTTQPNSIKYSHAVGHKKIYLTPNPKKNLTILKKSEPIKAKEEVFSSPIACSTPISEAASTPQRMVSGPPVHEKVVHSPRSVEKESLRTSMVHSIRVDREVTLPSLSSPEVPNSSSTSFPSMPMLSPKWAPVPKISPIVTASPDVSPVACGSQSVSPARSSFNIPLTRDQLFEHQLRTDQNGAINPDYRTPFKSKTDACKRLIRYHVLGDQRSSSNELMECDEQFQATADSLMNKFSSMKYKYQSLLLKDATRRHPSSETAMLYRLFIQEEKHNLEKERQDVLNGKDLHLPPVPSHWISGSPPPEGVPMPWEEDWPNQKVFTIQHKEQEDVPSAEDEEEEEPRLQILEDEESPREASGRCSGDSESGKGASSPVRDYPPDERTSRLVCKLSAKENWRRRHHHRVPPLKIRSKEERGGVAKLKLTLKKQQGSGDYYRVDEGSGDYYRVDDDSEYQTEAMGTRQLRNLSVVLEDCKKKRLKDEWTSRNEWTLKEDRYEHSNDEWSHKRLKEEWGPTPPYVDRWGRADGGFLSPPQYRHPSGPEVVHHHQSSRFS